MKSKKLLKSNTNDEKEPLEFKVLQFPFNFQPGTKSSIEFHEALQECTKESVFKSEAIQMILLYKWGLVRKFAIINATVLASFAIFLFFYIEFAFKDPKFVYALTGFGIYFLINEAINIYTSSFYEYFDLWNSIDFLGILLIFVHCISKLVVLHGLADENNVVFRNKMFSPSGMAIFSIINFLAWVRVISSLRIFTKTRALIRLVVQTMKDMIAFAIVLLVGIITFIICLDILNSTSDMKSFEGLG